MPVPHPTSKMLELGFRPKEIIISNFSLPAPKNSFSLENPPTARQCSFERSKFLYESSYVYQLS